MTTEIHPEALKTHRARKHWTQEQLADATRGPNKVSLPTIKRIESRKSATYPANDRVAAALSKALGVRIEDLAKAHSLEERGESLRKFGYRPLRAMVDAETALGFNMVQNIYGIPIRSQIEMAPLFAALLAEGSLAWRRKRVEAIKEAAANLMALGGGHFSFANAAYRAEDGALAERDSIAKRDIFGEHVSDDAYDLGYDPSENNPFADYLADFAKEVDAKTVTFDKLLGWKTSEGLPTYRIGSEILESLTGGDPDAEYALLRGHVHLKHIPDTLLGDANVAERVAWMISRIPSEELEARIADREELSALLDPPTDGDSATSQHDAEAEGANDV